MKGGDTDACPLGICVSKVFFIKDLKFDALGIRDDYGIINVDIVRRARLYCHLDTCDGIVNADRRQKTAKRLARARADRAEIVDLYDASEAISLNI